MGGRKKITNHRRTLGKTGNVDSPSYFLTIPIDLVRAMKWNEGQRISVKKSRGKIVLETNDDSEVDFDND